MIVCEFKRILAEELTHEWSPLFCFQIRSLTQTTIASMSSPPAERLEISKWRPRSLVIIEYPSKDNEIEIDRI
ncbi:hypothetical protein CXR27_02755 [Brevibacterium aurantiacum]|uniref:Uncharacterized protein n=1 Tax=Brevibacterium aurantiacum TaxID=273384 RepID=A0A3Q9NVH4_BREAU|nr:hypothetical protein CXR27_02755 [Brevibacterium aurantiacum]